MATARSIHVRLDPDAAAALDALAGAELTPSEAVRAALVDAAVRRGRRLSLAAEARRLMADPVYLEEAAETHRLMDELRAAW